MPHRHLICVSTIFGLALILSGVGCMRPVIPDQAVFRPLEELRTSKQAVARLYSAPIPLLQGIATHPWFLIKTANGTEFERWEVWQDAGGPYGHVRKNLSDPEYDISGGGMYILAEMTGSAAEPIVTFIAGQSPTYACRNQYAYLGVNSNTYAQWVLNQTGWNVVLPPTGIGKDVVPNCP